MRKSTTLYPTTKAEEAETRSRLLRGHYIVVLEVSGSGFSGPERRGWISYRRGHSTIDVVHAPAQP